MNEKNKNITSGFDAITAECERIYPTQKIPFITER